MTKICTQISDVKKKSPRTDFSACIFSPKLETPGSSKSMDIIDEREEHIDCRLGNFREAGHCLRLLCIWFAVIPLIGVFHSSLTLEISPWGTLAFILLVTFNCCLSPSLSCLILPHLSRISKIHLFSATSGHTVAGTEYYTACSVSVFTNDSPKCSGSSSHTLQKNITLFLLPASPAHSAVFLSVPNTLKS